MATIKAGISVSLTGQFQTQGRQALAGLQAWADYVNQAGGITVDGRKYPVDLVHYDDASLAEKASVATRTLILEDKVGLLFGPYSSGLARAAAEAAERDGQVLWNQGGAAEAVHRPGRRVVGILSGAGEYLSALPGMVSTADPTASTYGIARCSTGAFPRQVSDGLERQALARGFTKAIHLEFPPEQSVFDDLARQLCNARPDLLLVVGRIRHDIALARALVSCWANGERPKVSAVVAAPIKRFQEETGSGAEGFVGPSQWEPASAVARSNISPGYFGPSPGQALSSLERAAAVARVPVDYPMAQACAAGLVAQKCLEDAGSLEPELLWQAAGRLDFHTFFGRFRIDPSTGLQVGRSVFLVQWQQGRKVVIWPPEQAQGGLAIH